MDRVTQLQDALEQVSRLQRLRVETLSSPHYEAISHHELVSQLLDHKELSRSSLPPYSALEVTR